MNIRQFLKIGKLLALSTIIFSVAACAGMSRESKEKPQVVFGSEVLLSDPEFRSMLAGKNVALFSNQVFVDEEMNSLILRYFEAEDFNLVAMFAKEHGLRGQYQAGAPVPHEIDVETGVMIWSLYNAAPGWPRRPTADILRTRNIPQDIMRDAINRDLIIELEDGTLKYKFDNTLIDIILFDLPDIGSVAWTYPFMMADVMRSIAEFELYFDVYGNPKCVDGSLTYDELRAIPGHRIQLFILDRPNPLGGLVVEGPVRDNRPVAEGGIGSGSFWRFPMTSRYGLTLGELAKMFVGEWTHNWRVGGVPTLNPHSDEVRDVPLNTVDLTVVPVRGWTRDMYWDDWDPTGARFILPSPNMPTWNAAFLFTGTVWHEGTNMGERGINQVWTLIHTPFIDGFAFAERMNRFVDEHGILQGVRYRAIANTPINSDSQHQPFPGRLSDGVEIHITDKRAFRAIDDVLIHSLVTAAMYGPVTEDRSVDNFSFRRSMNVRVGNNVIVDAIVNFPYGATDEQIIAEFHRLQHIIRYGDPETGTPGNLEFIERRKLYLMGEYDVPAGRRQTPSLAPPLRPTVTLGYENLLSNHRYLFDGKRVGLVADHTSVTKNLGHLVDLLYIQPDLNLTTLFAPVPGLRGLRQDAVLRNVGHLPANLQMGFDTDVDMVDLAPPTPQTAAMPGGNVNERAYFPGGTMYIDRPTGLPVHRLAGAHTVPTAASLANVDVLIFDMWDSGVRYNSRIKLLADVMKAAAANNVKLVILDRPSMIDGAIVDGPVSESGKYAVPIRYAMTIGELAHLLKYELGHYTDIATESFDNLDLTVVRMSNWERTMNTKETGLPFVAPTGTANLVNNLGHISPIKIGTYEAALAYSVIGLVEGTALFDGLGTTRSMEAVGSPFITPQIVPFRDALAAFNLPGVNFRSVVHLPWGHEQARLHGVKYAGVNNVGGVQLHISDFRTFNTMETALAIFTTLRMMFPNYINYSTFIPPATGTRSFNEQIGNTWMKEMILNGSSIEAIKERYTPALHEFKMVRERHLLY